jgi:hypothetical protein
MRGSTPSEGSDARIGTLGGQRCADRQPQEGSDARIDRHPVPHRPLVTGLPNEVPHRPLVTGLPNEVPHRLLVTGLANELAHRAPGPSRLSPS